MKKSLRTALAAVLFFGAPATTVTAAPVQNEIMFLLDSSGGLYDSAYANWNAEINWVQNFINQTHRADGSNAYGITTFSGLNAVHNYDQNINNGGIKVLHGLWDGTPNPHPDGPPTPSSEQNPSDLNDYTSGITNGDFLGGSTRMTDALNFIREQFLTFGGVDTNKFIFVLTDGGFYPSQFIPADPDTGYVSTVLQSLLANDVNIAAVGVDPDTNGLGLMEAMISSPDLLFDVAGSDDFSDFLPAAQVAMPAPSALILFAAGFAVLAVRRRRG